MHLSGFRLIGLKLPHKTTNENNQANVDCGNLWQKFEKDNVFEKVPDKLSNEVFAVYYEYDKDETKPYSYFIGCKAGEDATVPEGLSEINIPAQDYIKITASGVMTGCVAEAWKMIWESKPDRKYTFDFEVYDERSQDWNRAEVDIFLSANL